MFLDPCLGFPSGVGHFYAGIAYFLFAQRFMLSLFSVQASLHKLLKEAFAVAKEAWLSDGRQVLHFRPSRAMGLFLRF
jgi:hypothetical protein